MADKIYTDFVVTTQGPIKINTIEVIKKTEDIVLLWLDCSCKRADFEIDSNDDNRVIISVCQDYDEEKIEFQYTVIELPEYKGYKHFCSEWTRYGLKLCLIKA